MKHQALLKHFTQREINESAEINPLACAESKFFNQKYELGVNYRDQAIDYVATNKLPFASTCNSIFNIAERFISVVCCYCGGKTKSSGGGGNGSMMTVDYFCENPDCNARHSLTFHDGGIRSNIQEKTA